MIRSPGYAVLCLLVLALCTPGPFIHHPNWPRSADFWATATPVNITIDDTSSLIAYSADNTWRSSTASCQTCLNPSERLAYAGTWHDGTHILPTSDSDDFSATTKTDVKASQSAAPGDDDSGGYGNGRDEDADGRNGHDTGEKERRSEYSDGEGAVRLLRRDHSAVNNPFFTPNLDSDDPGFVDKPVTVQFNFTGSAIYVYAIVPEFAAPANTTPTSMNLTFTLDSQVAGTFIHTGDISTPNTAYTPAVSVFQKTGLPTTPHTLTIAVGPDSVFLFDYITYTQDRELDTAGNSTNGAAASSTSTPSAVGAANASPSPVISQSTAAVDSSSSNKAHNVATFAGAIGGSVGLLSVLALSLAFSIYRRRVLARRRDRAYRENRDETSSIGSYHTDASEDGPPMQGPAPFVPRYFPGTVIHAAPPPYSPPAAPSNEQTSSLLGPPETLVSWSSRRTGGVVGDSESYAERPPPTPPPGGSIMGADVEDGYFAPPPPFPVAIATPVPAILAGLSGLSSPTTPASPSRPASPMSPVVPLLPPPPSSRPPSFHSTNDQTPGAGPSSSQTVLAPVPTPAMQPVVLPQPSMRSLRSHTPEEPPSGVESDTHSIGRSSSEPIQTEGTTPALIAPIISIRESQGGTGGQGLDYRSEGGGDSMRR